MSTPSWYHFAEIPRTSTEPPPVDVGFYVCGLDTPLTPNAVGDKCFYPWPHDITASYSSAAQIPMSSRSNVHFEGVVN
eukprot:518080-Amphidinium_carterae.1